jgi:hypothetical protein
MPPQGRAQAAGGGGRENAGACAPGRPSPARNPPTARGPIGDIHDSCRNRSSCGTDSVRLRSRARMQGGARVGRPASRCQGLPRTRASTEPLDQASDAGNTASHHALDQDSSVKIMDVLDLLSRFVVRFASICSPVQIMDVLDLSCPQIMDVLDLVPRFGPRFASKIPAGRGAREGSRAPYVVLCNATGQMLIVSFPKCLPASSRSNAATDSSRPKR